MPREHITDGGECWCQPRLLIVCPECNADATRQPCWQCEDVGTIPYVPQPFEALSSAVIVVHNDTGVVGDG